MSSSVLVETPLDKDKVGYLNLSVAELLAGIEQPGSISLAAWRLSLLLPGSLNEQAVSCLKPLDRHLCM
ncbi:MAG: hypothetical protein M3Z24_17055 [Chloroflexota bacterium]|nr:hypothetical protein [Chloroflexota bacterium]